MKRTPQFDLDGNPIVPMPKCKHCGKTRWDHRAKTLECPNGSKSRVGYTWFGPAIFEAHDAKK